MYPAWLSATILPLAADRRMPSIQGNTGRIERVSAPRLAMVMLQRLFHPSRATVTPMSSSWVSHRSVSAPESAAIATHSAGPAHVFATVLGSGGRSFALQKMSRYAFFVEHEA